MMRIESVDIKNLRGVQHLQLADLPATGVVVIRGENEAGKSTLVEAIGTVLREKHTAASKRIRALQPADQDAGPEVTLQVVVGECRFRIHKRWLKNKVSELEVLSPRRANYNGSEAEEQLSSILSKHLDVNLLSTLFMRQDDEGEAIEAVGIPSLTRALEAASGMDEKEIVGENSELMAKVEEEFQRYFTASNNTPRREYAKAISDLENAREEQERAEAARRELDGVVTRYEKLSQEKREAEGKLPQAQAELAEREEEVQRARELKEKIERLRAQAEHARSEAERAQDMTRARTALRENQERAKRGVEAARTALEAAQETVRGENLQRAQHEEQAAQAKERYLRSRERLQRLRRRQQRTQLENLTERIAHLDGLSQRLRQAKEHLAAAPEITAADITKLRDALSDYSVAQKVHAAAAAKLVLEAEGEASVLVDGSPVTVGSSTVVELVDGTEIDFGAVTARYDAGAARGEDSAAQVEEAEQRVHTLLETLGVVSVQEAEDMHEDYLARTRAVEEINRELELELHGEKLDRLRTDRAQLEAQIRAAAASDAAQDTEPESADPDDGEEMTVAEAEKAEEAARAESEEKNKRLEAFRDSLAQRKEIEAEAKAEALAAELGRCEEALRVAREEARDEELAAAAEQAQARRAEAEQALAEVEESEKDFQTVEGLYAGAKALVESLRGTIHDTELNLGKLSSFIQLETGAEERADRAAAELENASRVHASVERRANAAKYLRELLQEHRVAARQRYAQPFTQALEKLARVVFGGEVTFNLSEELGIEARSQEGRTVDFDSLSGGAREQLAILTRFAIAELVATPGKDGEDLTVPVIIDDALGSTDPHRLQLISTLFSRVGESSQVIALTCVPERFARVPSKIEYDIERLKEPAIE